MLDGEINNLVVALTFANVVGFAYYGLAYMRLRSKQYDDIHN